MRLSLTGFSMSANAVAVRTSQTNAMFLTVTVKQQLNIERARLRLTQEEYDALLTQFNNDEEALLEELEIRCPKQMTLAEWLEEEGWYRLNKDYYQRVRKGFFLEETEVKHIEALILDHLHYLNR